MKGLKPAVATLVLSLVALGCSGGNGDGPGTGGTSSPTSSPTTQQPSEPTNGSEEPGEDDAWQAVIEAAKDEGHVTWYSVAPAASREGLQQAFAQVYPEIELEILTMTMAEMEAALEQERSSGTRGADVVTSVNFGWVLDRVDEGWWFDLEGPAVESGWVGTDYLVDGKILQAPLGLIVIGWNTSLFDGELTGYEDLLDERLGNGVIGMARAEPAIHGDFWAFLEDEMGADFMESFAEQSPTLYPSAFALQEALAAGEVAVGGFVSAADMMSLQSNGAPIEFVVPSPVWAAQNWFYGVEWSQNPNAARLFLDFVASPEGQLAAARDGATPLPEVAPQTLGAGAQVVLTNVERMLDPGWYDPFLAQWRERFEG